MNTDCNKKEFVPSSRQDLDCWRLNNTLDFQIDNIIVDFDGQAFQQTIDIPMGTNCTPLLFQLVFSPLHHLLSVVHPLAFIVFTLSSFSYKTA